MKLGSVAAVVCAALALSACGGGGEKSVPNDQAIQPSKGDAGWARTDVRGITISVPTEWEKKGPIDAGPDAEAFTFQSDTNDFGTRGGAQLLTLDKRTKGGEKMVKALGDEARAVAGAKKIKSTKVIWPGAEAAWLLTYVAYPPSGGKVAAHPTEVLVLDLEGGAQAQATVTALKADFERQKLHSVLETVAVTDSVGSKKS